MTEDEAQAILGETEALLDTLAETGEVILRPGDVGVAAVTGLAEMVQAYANLVGLYRRAARGEL